MGFKPAGSLLDPKKLSQSQKQFLAFHEKALRKRVAGSPRDLRAEQKVGSLKRNLEALQQMSQVKYLVKTQGIDVVDPQTFRDNQRLLQDLQKEPFSEQVDPCKENHNLAPFKPV